ncbi:MAG: hypothetical protein MH825_06305 [Cyanobacteria bacterium]|nr:hypothetical protein [Cyanobacteriota bacterium]
MGDRAETILLFWDCPDCGHPHIEGPTKRCPGCFYWRDRAVKFYETPESRVLTAEEEAKYTNPDWICKVCGAANADEGLPVDQLLCGSCNQWQTNNLDLGNTNPDRLPTNEVVNQRPSHWIPPAPRRDPDTPPTPTTSTNWRRRIAIGALGLGGSATVWAGVTLLSPQPIEAEILARFWTVTVEVQEKRPTTDSGWNLPSDAYSVSSSTRQSGTRQVQVGTRQEKERVSYREKTGTKQECKTVSKGNGTGTRSCKDVPVYTTKYRTETKTVPVYRDEPIYDTWYRYTVDRWKQKQILTQEGQEGSPRTPPSVRLTNRPYPEQTLAPVETCWLQVSYGEKGEQKMAEWSLPCDQYDRLRRGQTAQFEKSALGGVRLLDPAKTAKEPQATK